MRVEFEREVFRDLTKSFGEGLAGNLKPTGRLVSAFL